MPSKRKNSEGQESRAPHSGGQLDLQQALQACRAENQRLAEENAALRQQLARQEDMRKEEQESLLSEKNTLFADLQKNIDYIKKISEDVTVLKAEQNEAEEKRKGLQKKLKEKQLEILSLQEDLCDQRMETEKVILLLRSAQHKVEEMKLSSDKTVADLNAEWEKRWTIEQEEVTAELTALKQRCDRILQEKDKETSKVKKGMAAKAHQIEARWTNQCKALEHNLHSEHAERKRCQKEMVELQEKKKRHMEMLCLALENERRSNEEKWVEREKKWLSREEEMTTEARESAEQINVLILKSIRLQEQALMTDEEKAKMRNKEKRAQKEAEKRLEETRRREKKEQERRERD